MNLDFKPEYCSCHLGVLYQTLSVKGKRETSLDAYEQLTFLERKIDKLHYVLFIATLGSILDTQLR